MSVIKGITIILVIHSSQITIYGFLFDKCVTPPLICPNPNITFWLYNRNTEHNPYELSVIRPDTIANASFVPGDEIKILVHGYTGHRDYDPNIDCRPAYLRLRDMNVISVDYGPLVRDPCYLHATLNVPLISKCTAQFIDALVNIRGINLTNIHVVGLSLGAHVSGGISNWIQSGKLERITGLDPALPLFVTPNPYEKLEKSDAKFVDIIHTDVLGRGKLEYLGHLDHFVNGGRRQKGCEQYTNMTMSQCSHWRSALYFAESINAPLERSFYGKICSSWFLYKFGYCPSNAPELIMGEYATKPSSDVLAFVETNANAPFAMGPSSDYKAISSKLSNDIASVDNDFEYWFSNLYNVTKLELNHEKLIITKVMLSNDMNFD